MVVSAICVALAGWGSAAPESLPLWKAGGETYVRLADVAKFYGLRATPVGDQLVLSSVYHSMIFESASRRMSLMDVQVWLQYPVGRMRGRWVLHPSDAQLLIDPILRPYRHLAHRGSGLVVLDAGHGGRDGGAESVAGGLLEKDLALDIARRVREYLPPQGWTVRMTRDSDTFLELEERSRLAALWRPDVFVSIHCNSGPDANAQGVETYILSKAGAASTNARDPSPAPSYRFLPGNHHDAASAVLGFSLQRRMLRWTQAQDRGLRHARFAVLRDAPCAAALVECGFLSNRDEAQRLADREYRDRLARAIAQGILDYGAAVQKARLAVSR
ncbi:MAG: N-acetylmuramoyl-L-alanine amidase [Kiritimatiellae bacterium]|nr:N-acetylmuramoyl-L-alanine amidase [Kiritimatiellia bacterium]